MRTVGTLHSPNLAGNDPLFYREGQSNPGALLRRERSAFDVDTASAMYRTSFAAAAAQLRVSLGAQEREALIEDSIRHVV